MSLETSVIVTESSGVDAAIQSLLGQTLRLELEAVVALFSVLSGLTGPIGPLKNGIPRARGNPVF